MRKRSGAWIAIALITLSVFVASAYPMRLYRDTEVVIRFGGPREYWLVQQQRWEWIPGPDTRERQITAEQFESLDDRLELHSRTAGDYFGYEVPNEERYRFTD